MTRGWIVTRSESGGRAADVRLGELDAVLAPPDGAIGDVEVAVTYSSVNYKDALAFEGHPGVARISPLVPGIDVVGTVVSSSNPRWSVGDRVILNGGGAGETRPGGLAERALLDGSTLVVTPRSLSDAEAASIGTAGFTAMLAVLALERHGITGGRALVTGATGGLGSFAVALLARAGFTVTAATRRAENAELLRALGASDVVDAQEFDREARPLESQRYRAVVDAVGGRMLATALAQLEHDGAAVACGNAAAATLPTTVMPFILRGTALLGVNSTQTPTPLREQAWQRLAVDLERASINRVAQVVPLEAAHEIAAEILAGTVVGRRAVRVADEEGT